MRIGIIFRPVARAGSPNQFAGFFVERVKAVGGRALRAPVGGDAARDDQVPINDRRSGAAVGKGEPAKFFHQRMLPKQFAVGVETGKNALRALHENIAGFRIDGGARSGVTQINRIAQKIVVELLPKFFAGFGIEASHAFLQSGPSPR